MIKVIAIGDIHAEYVKMWRILKHSYAMVDGRPSDPLVRGTYQVVLIGDLVHPKTLEQYAAISGIEDFTMAEFSHLKSAARAQFRELARIKHFQEQAAGNFTVIMGNHDHAATYNTHMLGNRMLEHREFHPELGGMAMPDEIKAWFKTFVPERNFFGVNFAHVGPTPWLQQYDDMFYASREAKEWWIQDADYVQRMGHRFGVYGHTVMSNGIHVTDKLALIDALDSNQYLELILDDNLLEWEIKTLPELSGDDF